jgi:DNA-binding MarR family transcriptional regulator
MADPRWLDDEEQRAWRAYIRASRMVMERLERDLQVGSGLPVTYYEVLVELSEAPGRTLRMSELARRSLSSPSRLSHAVARMESLGWIRRESCPSDRRGSFAVLTDEGFKVIEAAAPGHVESIRAHFFDHLTREQIDQVREIGEAVARHLQEDRNASCDRAEAEAGCDG